MQCPLWISKPASSYWCWLSPIAEIPGCHSTPLRFPTKTFSRPGSGKESTPSVWRGLQTVAWWNRWRPSLDNRRSPLLPYALHFLGFISDQELCLQVDIQRALWSGIWRRNWLVWTNSERVLSDILKACSGQVGWILCHLFGRCGWWLSLLILLLVAPASRT